MDTRHQSLDQKKAKLRALTNAAKLANFNEDDMKEHLKLTCGIIIDDLCQFWDSYSKKFED